MNKYFKLRGLAEGVVGSSCIKAINSSKVFMMFPKLKKVRSKLIVKNNTITGFAQCDG